MRARLRPTYQNCYHLQTDQIGSLKSEFMWSGLHVVGQPPYPTLCYNRISKKKKKKKMIFQIQFYFRKLLIIVLWKLFLLSKKFS